MAVVTPSLAPSLAHLWMNVSSDRPLSSSDSSDYAPLSTAAAAAPNASSPSSSSLLLLLQVGDGAPPALDARPAPVPVSSTSAATERHVIRDPSSANKLSTYRTLWRRRRRSRSEAGHTAAAMVTPAPTPTLTPSTSAASPASAMRATTTPPPRDTRRMTEEERLEKHRMIVRRSYYQKKELKARLRDEIADLEAQFAALVTETQALEQQCAQSLSSLQHTSNDPRASAETDPSDGLYHCATCMRVQQLRAEYRRVSITKESLRAQRDALEHQLLQHAGFHDKLDQQLVRQTQERLASTAAATPGELAAEAAVLAAQPGFITVETSELGIVSFAPVTESECFAIIRASLQDMRSQHASSAAFRDVGVPVMGWNRKRTYGGTRAHFSLLKRFAGHSAARLWAATWQLYTESRAFEQLYSATVNMRFHVLQRVNDNNVLFCRTLKTERLRCRNATFFLLSRFQVEDGKCFLLFRSVDETRVHAENQPPDALLGMFSWLSFQDVSDGGACEIEFGGLIPSASVADTDFWMMEFASYLLRLENRVISPIFDFVIE
ncbi:hypothetical protein PINS_up006034 [Pythium insidiosum]|nr:hypothetical protein PINS_up006034 [Pythium insidiosum]